MTDHPDTQLGPPCPRCERDGVRVLDEDGRRVWRCPDTTCTMIPEGDDDGQ